MGLIKRNPMLRLARAVARRRAPVQQAASRLFKPHQPLPLFESVGAVTAHLGNGERWREDTGPIGDRWIHPEVTEARIASGHHVGSFDCDDHALYHAAAFIGSGLAEKVALLFVDYSRGGEIIGAHVVAVFWDAAGRRWWVDYREPRPIKSYPDAAREIGQKYGAKMSTWAVAHVTGLTRTGGVRLHRRRFDSGQA